MFRLDNLSSWLNAETVPKKWDLGVYIATLLVVCSACCWPSIFMPSFLGVTVSQSVRNSIKLLHAPCLLRLPRLSCTLCLCPLYGLLFITHLVCKFASRHTGREWVVNDNHCYRQTNVAWRVTCFPAKLRSAAHGTASRPICNNHF